MFEDNLINFLVSWKLLHTNFKSLFKLAINIERDFSINSV